ncbi:MAG: hydantoinase B/oxoprolinase family protein, partial [Candidatus Eremiobacteraeota bacterium]|nr:hydantoinase B/oxoprolinase family protein [Candidatus Eremiobacteraeota bacterium]
VAGNFVGERRFLELVARYGLATVNAAIEKALDDGERRTRAALEALPDGIVEQTDVLEDERGEPTIELRVRIEKRRGAVRLDYTGTAPQRAMPLNSVYGVTLSGAYYALRAVTDPRIPMNDGSFRPIEVHVPEGTLLNPRRPAPVSAGNVETSMRNADLVLAALAQLAPGRVPAQSGGSMNNLLVGGLDDAGRSWAFYETNGCGMGARPHADGIDGIHAHMTNTLNTPIEAIERQLPMLVTAYEFAEQSAGAGAFRGGCGLVRAFALRAGTATASLLAERHAVRPQGANGGGDGAPGAHLFVSREGAARQLPAKATVAMEPGDAIIMRTAGGGGYGDPAARDLAAVERDLRDGIATAE